MGKRVPEVIPGIRESDPQVFEIYGRVALTGVPERFETFVKALGMWFAVSVYSPQPEYFVAVFDVITERKRAEEALRHSLAEKTALLKEVHHRVKNNLQIVASLLRLQANRSPLPEVLEGLEDTGKRVHSMALLHETLYRSDNLARINFAAYVGQLCRHLQRSAGPVAARVEVDHQVTPLGLPLEPAPGQKLVLCVGDNGVGPPPFKDLLATPTLGLRLVSGLASQLGGQLSATQPEGGGIVFQVVFPAPEDTLTKENPE